MKLGAWDSKGPWATIVAIVSDVKYRGLDVDSEFSIYLPYTQATAGDLNFLVRTKGNPLRLAEAVRREIWAVDRDLAIYSVRSMTEVLANSLWQRRVWGTLLAVFASVALLLAGLGVYGVLAYFVEQRTSEIGLRMALGAQPSRVMQLVTLQGLVPVLAGDILGLVGALVASRWVGSLLFGVTGTDAVAFTGGSSALLPVALLACYLPARRAARLNPVAALRRD